MGSSSLNPMGNQMNLSTMNNTSPTLSHTSRGSISHMKNSPGSRHSSLSSATSHSMMQMSNNAMAEPHISDTETAISSHQDTSTAEPVEESKLPSYLRRKKPPKAKFTADDDDLLVELKEKKKLTWKQIADHFDGRTAGALQVRYCTKLKGRSIDWTDEDVETLHEAMREYEEERWIIVSQKMGSKFTASICRDKFKSITKKESNSDDSDQRQSSSGADVADQNNRNGYETASGTAGINENQHYMQMSNGSGASHEMI